MKTAVALLCSLLFFAGCSGEPKDQNVPVSSLWITVPDPATKHFLVELERFATSRGFVTRKSVVHPDGKDFSIEMNSAEFRIISVNDLNAYEVFFYPRLGHSSPETSAATLAGDMKRELGKVGGVTFPTSRARMPTIEETRTRLQNQGLLKPSPQK